MKAAIKISVLFIVLNAGMWLVPQKASAQVSVSFQLFYDDLSPYGYWVDHSDYGYVWYPNVSAGFTPYGTNGHWVFTNAGWTWHSNYPWGWAPFHYGRWYSDPVYGPMWVPGNEWGPGWVTWRSSAGYYGWAPIGPGISIDIAYSNSYSLPYNQWTFVRDRDFGRTNINNYYVDRSTNTTIINNSTVINNIQADNSSGAKYNAGPQRIEAEKRSGKSFTPVVIKESNKPGQKLNNNQLEIYRPRVDNSSGQKSAPAKVANLKDVKPASERKTETRPAKENQPVKSRPAQQQQNTQPSKQQPSKQPRDNQPKKEQQQQNAKPEKQQPSQPRDNQPKKEERQQNAQPEKKQPSQQPHDNQPKKEQHQQNAKPEKQQPSQQPRDNELKKEQRQENAKPEKQQPSQKNPKRSVSPKQQKQPEQQSKDPSVPQQNDVHEKKPR